MLVLLHLLLLPLASRGFICNQPSRKSLYRETRSSQNLVPISKFRSEITYLDQDDSIRICLDKDGRFIDDETYELCLVEEEDLPDLSRFIIDAFGAEAISMSGDFSSFERALMGPTVGMLNAYSGLVAFAEVLSGLQTRTKDRIKKVDLSPPPLLGSTREEKLKEAARSSLVLALGRRSKGSDWHIDVIASVELRLQPCDAKIPFSFPWLDRFERNVASMVGVDLGSKARDLKPYVSNLCVCEKYRGRNIGKALVRCTEDIATNCWGYSKVFLHVDLDNTAARTLYMKEGYKDAGRRWNPFWAGKAADIGYYCKRFGKKKEEERKPGKAEKSTSK